MSAISISSPFPTFTDVDGDPLESGYIYVGQANVDPVTFPIAVYWDVALTIPAAQPIRTIGGYPARNGSPARIYANSDYSIRVNNKNGSLVYSSPAATDRLDSWQVGYDGGTVQDVLDAVTGPTGAASVGYIPAGTGAVATTVQSKLRETVSADDYIPLVLIKEVYDCAPYINLALDTGKDVELPSDAYFIASPLKVRGQKLLGKGHTIDNGTFCMTKLIVHGNTPAVQYYPGLYSTFEIDGLFIYYGDTAPTTALGNDKKIGIDFTEATGSPQMVKVSNCIVKGGWRGYYNTSGSYLSIFERFWSWNCKFNFTHIGGTTLELNTCYALGGSQGFNIQGCVGVTSINSGFDRIVVDADTPQNTANLFAGIPALNLITFGGELNEATRDGSSLVWMQNCNGVWNGYFGVQNKLSCASGQEVYGLNFYNSKIKISGSKSAVNIGDLAFTGTGGNCYTVSATNGSEIQIDTSEFKAATGGTSTFRISLGQDATSKVYYSSTVVDNIVQGIQFVPQTGISWTPVLNTFSNTGSPIVTGKIWQSGTRVDGLIAIDPNGGSVTGYAGTANITGIPVKAPAFRTSFNAVTNSVVPLGTGLLTEFGEFYIPTISNVTEKIFISFTYFTE